MNGAKPHHLALFSGESRENSIEREVNDAKQSYNFVINFQSLFNELLYRLD